MAPSLFEAVTERMDKLEKMLNLIMATMGIEGLPVQDSKREGSLPPTKLNQKTKTEAPKEDSVPLPPFGWKSVARKEKKKENGKKTVKTEEKRMPLKLFDKDWSVQVLSREDAKLGVDGVLMTSDEDAKELMPMFRKQCSKFVLVTPNKLDESSKQFDCRVITSNDRITKMSRWYTNIGCEQTFPVYHQTGNDTPKITLTNSTVKVVLQIVKKYSSNKDWNLATGNPGAALRDWIKEANAFTHLVHSFRPVHKDNLLGGASWIEQVVIMKAEGAKKIMHASGAKGIFAKRFLGENEPQDTGDWRIVWLGHDIALKTAVDRGELLGSDYKGLAHGHKGLGVRVPQTSYKDCGEKLMGDRFVPTGDNSYIYEVSKVPIWVNPDDLIAEMTAQMAWVTEFVRVNNSYGQLKSFLVRGSLPPPKDCIFMDDSLLLIQPAKPTKGGKFAVSYFEGKVFNDNKKTEARPVPTQRTVVNAFVGPDGKRRKCSI